MQVLSCGLCVCVGILVDTTAGIVTARALLLAFSVDLPAKALITNMKQWNGIQGYLYCADEGATLANDHLHRYWPQQQSS